MGAVRPGSQPSPLRHLEDAKRPDHKPHHEEAEDDRKTTRKPEQPRSGVEGVEDWSADEHRDDARAGCGDVREAHVEAALVRRNYVLDESPVHREENAKPETDDQAAERGLGGQVRDLEQACKGRQQAIRDPQEVTEHEEPRARSTTKAGAEEG